MAHFALRVALNKQVYNKIAKGLSTIILCEMALDFTDPIFVHSQALLARVDALRHDKRLHGEGENMSQQLKLEAHQCELHPRRD